MRFEPLTLTRPTPESAARFCALPYDVFDRAEARANVEAHPGSFLEIDRAETSFPPDHDMYAPEVYARAAELLAEREADGTLVEEDAPRYFLYRQRTPSGHVQTGIVGGFSTADYDAGLVRRHERIRPEKLGDRIAHIGACRAQTGPIFLTYRDSPAVDAVVDRVAQGAPLLSFDACDGVATSVWRVGDPADEEALRRGLADVSGAYIADGHHRCAAAVETARRAGADGLVLAVLYPAGQLACLPYNRVVADAAGLSPAGLADAVRAAGFEVAPADGPVEPEGPGRYGMYHAGRWWRLRAEGRPACGDPVAALDAQVLQDRVLAPVLGVEDPASSPRIEFVGGVRGLGELERRAGASGVAFSLHATTIAQLMDVADAGRLMPPKSTWFEPKILSGLFAHRIG